MLNALESAVKVSSLTDGGVDGGNILGDDGRTCLLLLLNHVLYLIHIVLSH